MADKHTVAQLLSKHTERWTSPAEIKAEMTDVPDRTLSRWLGELLHEGVIERSGTRKGTRYRLKPTAKEEQRLALAVVSETPTPLVSADKSRWDSRLETARVSTDRYAQ
jgi:DNA-binding IclR family transcriptional regulator